MGWAVEVDAETGQPIDFGLDESSTAAAAGWDAAVVMLGTNYGSDRQRVRPTKLRQILDQLRQIPVMLLTVTPYEERLNEVNYVIRVLAEEYDDVRVVDWGGRTGRTTTPPAAATASIRATRARALVQMIARGLGPAERGWQPMPSPSASRRVSRTTL